MTQVSKLARVAYTFMMMNYAAVAGLMRFRRGQSVWR